MTLSDTHLLVLNAAAARPDKLVTKHKRLPGASLQKVCAALVKRGLLAELTGVCRSASTSSPPDPEVLHVKTELGMTEYAITPAGLRAIGVDDESPYGEELPKDVRAGVDPFLIEGPDNNPPDEADTAPTGAQDAAEAATPAADATARPTATTAPTRAGLRAAAQAVLEAWDDEENQRYGLTEAIDGLRAALAGTTRAHREPGTPRAGTKQEAVLALLRRAEGATIAQIVEATQWQSHTVRGFLAGLKRKGITVEVLERVRHRVPSRQAAMGARVGPNREGAKGSYSVYRARAEAR
jgi:hypothetical protein